MLEKIAMVLAAVAILGLYGWVFASVIYLVATGGTPGELILGSLVIVLFVAGALVAITEVRSWRR